MPLKIGEPAETKRKMVYDMTLQEAREHYSQTQDFLDSVNLVNPFGGDASQV
jgi:hypothetical protein